MTGSDPQPLALTPAALLRLKLTRARLKLTPVWGQIRRVSDWYDRVALPLAKEDGRDSVRLDFRARDDNPTLALAGSDEAIDQLGPLGELLALARIKQLRLGIRLDGRQLEGVLVLLWAIRRSLDRPSDDWRNPALCRALRAGPGVHVSCAHTYLRDRVLHVQYSYCTTCFSRLIRWIEQRSRRYRDHRVLFHAAPRWASILALVGALPLVVAWAWPYGWVLAITAALELGLLFSLVYILLLTAGSLEYDNEEKAFRLERALDELQGYARSVQENLRRAKALQRSILPDVHDMPLADKLDWASSFTPESEVGGDYFDAAMIGAQRVGLLFADVSGHGMAAALVTSILKSAFDAWIEDRGELTPFVGRLNRMLCRILPDESFAAVIVGIYDAPSRTLTYLNCGHSPQPILIPDDPSQPVGPLSDAHTMILGVLPDIRIEPADRQLAPGDTVVLVTDGFVETRNRDGEMYGTHRLEGLLAARRCDNTECIIRTVAADVTTFAAGAAQQDDRAALAFRIR